MARKDVRLADHTAAQELIGRFNRWRRVFEELGIVDVHEPICEDGRLHFRWDKPDGDWSAYVIEVTPDGHYMALESLAKSQDVRDEHARATFSRLQDAGKYVVYEFADVLRVLLGLDSLEQTWQYNGLASGVTKVAVSDGLVKYVLDADASVYCFGHADGVAPHNHLLGLSYDEVDTIILEGFPENLGKLLDA